MNPKGYTTKQEIENYLLITVDPSFDAQIGNWIAMMERYIDREAGRNFAVPAEEDTSRLYDGDGSRCVIIDDAAEITKVETDATGAGTFEELDAAKWKAYPGNAAADGEPYTRLQLTVPTPTHDLSVKVTGRFGWPATPEDITFAATVLVAGIVNFSGNTQGDVKTMVIGNTSVTYKDDKQWQDFARIEEILASYRRPTSG